MSTRVEQIIAEIAQLTEYEQGELTRMLPAVLRPAAPRGLTREAVERAIATRERIRARLLAERKPLFSVVDDLDAMRDERLDELERARRPSGQSRRDDE